jgi:methyl-accepting chemotaxis protein
MGLSERAFREGTTALGGQLKGLGFDLEDAATKSVDLIRVAADLAATYGGTTAEAVQALGAAFRGEADPAERFNLFLNQSRVNAEAVALGLAESTSEVDANAKAQATLSLITKQSADAQGQFARETGTAAGQMQIATASIEDAMANLGESVAPIIASVAGAVADAAGAFTRLNESTGGVASQVATFGTLALGAVGALSFLAGSAIRARDRFKEIGGSFRDAEGNLTRFGRTAKTTAIGLGALGVALAGFEIVDALRGDFADLSDEIERFLSASRDATPQALVDEFENLVKAADDSRSTFNKFTDAITLADHETDAFKERFRELARTTPENARALLEAFQDTNVETKVTAEGVAKLQQIFDEVNGSAEVLAGSQQDVADATAAVGESSRDSAAAAEALGQAQEDAVAAAEDLAEAEQAVADALNEQALAAFSAADAGLALEAARGGVQDATRDTAAAELQLAAAIQEHGEASPEATEAFLALGAAITSERDAAISAGKAAGELATQQAEAEGRIASTVEVIDAQNRELLEQARTATPNARKAITDYIAEANRIPPEKVTEIEALIAQGKLAEAERLINETSRTRTTAINAEAHTQDAESAIQRLIRERNARINVQLVGAGAAGFGVGRFAEGGVLGAGALGIVGEAGQPELVHFGGKSSSNFVTGPGFITGPASITGGDETMKAIAAVVGASVLQALSRIQPASGPNVTIQVGNGVIFGNPSQVARQLKDLIASDKRAGGRWPI